MIHLKKIIKNLNPVQKDWTKQLNDDVEKRWDELEQKYGEHSSVIRNLRNIRLTEAEINESYRQALEKVFKN
jgi:hypothetical protein